MNRIIQKEPTERHGKFKTGFNRWTVALASAGLVSIGSVVQAEETPHQVLTALSSTTLSGYVNTSAIWKLGTGTQLVGRAFDGTAKQDGINLDVVKLSLEKPLDEAEWAAGYKVDLLFGPDAVAYNNTVGIAATDFSFKQAYVVLRAPVGNGIDFKIGTFDTCIGYEVFDGPANPNYSRSYGYTLEPLAHTGVMASYQVCSGFSLSAGVANTWITGVNARPLRAAGVAADESEKTYMGLMSLTAPESFGFLKGAVLSAGIVDGINNPGASDTTSYYVGATMPTPWESLSWGASYDYRGTKADAANSTYANAVALYTTYQATEKLKFNSRVEYATGTTGTTGTWIIAPAAPTASKAGDGEAFLGYTLTADYSLWGPNVMTRAEFRWDHDLKGRNGAAVHPFVVNDKNAMSLALNVVYKF